MPWFLVLAAVLSLAVGTRMFVARLSSPGSASSINLFHRSAGRGTAKSWLGISITRVTGERLGAVTPLWWRLRGGVAAFGGGEGRTCGASSRHRRLLGGGRHMTQCAAPCGCSLNTRGQSDSRFRGRSRSHDTQPNNQARYDLAGMWHVWQSAYTYTCVR